ncbi:hypothetical protein R3P38DRAFT_3340034 [Favolaschia claudopus]|uniref:Uncharacterized protein n=1 Tax=Favolaschia claudopus TaxID=2862362 RepID=A0AAW0EKM0_9AGAR
MSLHKQADCLALPGTPPQAGPSSDESESTRPQRVTQLDGPWNHRGFKDGKVDSERLGSLLAAKVDPEDSSLPRLFSNFFQAMSAFDSTALQLQRLEKLLNGRRRADLVLKALGFPNSLYYHSQPHGESREAVSILAPMLLADRLALLAEPENLAEPLRGGKPQLNWSPISPDRSTFTDWWASLQAARKLYLVNRDTFDDVGGGKLICQKFIQQARSTRTARVRLNLEVFVYLLKRYLKGDPFLKPETIRSFVIERVHVLFIPCITNVIYREADKVLEDEEEVQRLISQFDLIEIITPLFVAVIYGSCSLFSRHGFVTRKGCLYLPVWLQQSNIPSREAGNGLTVLDDTLLLLALRAALGKISIAQMSAAFFTDPKVMAILEQDPGWDARQVLRNDQERAEVVKSGTVVKSEQEFQRLTPFLIPAPQNIVAHEHPLYTSGAGVPPAPTRFFLQPDVEEVKFKGNDYPTHVQGDSRTVLLQRLPENTSHQREKSPRSSLDAETAENVVSKTVPDGTSSALTAQDDVLESMSEEEEEVMKMVIVKGMDIMGKAEHNSNERLGQQKQEKTKDQGRGQKQQVHDKQARNVRNQKKDNSNEVLQNDTDRSLRNEQKQMQREAADAKKRKRLVQAGNEEHEEDDALSGGILPITRKRRREDNVGGSAPTASDGETQATASSAPSSFSVPPSTAKESDAELILASIGGAIERKCANGEGENGITE